MKFKPGDKFILELGKRKLNKYEIAGTDLYVLIEMLEKLTPYKLSEDTVEVVRCKDCKCFDVAKNNVNGFCTKLGIPFDAYDYCSVGERKNGEQNENY